MKQEVEQETELRRYLLGDLSLADQVLVEQRLFLDDEYAELAQAVEDELVDEYVHDDLDHGERKKFESHFLKQPEHKDNLKIAEALKKHLHSEVVVQPQSSVSSTPSTLIARRKPIVWYALAAVLIVFSILMWIGLQSLRRKSSEPLETHQQQPAQTPANIKPNPSPSLVVNREDHQGDQQVAPRNSNSEPDQRQANKLNDKPQSAANFTAVILPGAGSRGDGQITKVTISNEVKELTLMLPLIQTGKYDKYHFELLHDGNTIATGDLKQQVHPKWGRVVFVRVPASSLTEQSYDIKLHRLARPGVSSEETNYPFTLERN
jgi:hypothetical protein